MTCGTAARNAHIFLNELTKRIFVTATIANETWIVRLTLETRAHESYIAVTLDAAQLLF